MLKNTLKKRKRGEQANTHIVSQCKVINQVVSSNKQKNNQLNKKMNNLHIIIFLPSLILFKHNQWELLPFNIVVLKPVILVFSIGKGIQTCSKLFMNTICVIFQIFHIIWRMQCFLTHLIHKKSILHKISAKDKKIHEGDH